MRQLIILACLVVSMAMASLSLTTPMAGSIKTTKKFTMENGEYVDQVVVGIVNQCAKALTLDASHTVAKYANWMANPPAIINGGMGQEGYSVRFAPHAANATVVYQNVDQWGLDRPLIIFFAADGDDVSLTTIMPEGVPSAMVQSKLGSRMVIQIGVGNSTHTSDLC